MVLNFGEKEEEEDQNDSKWQPGMPGGSGNSTPHNQNLIGKDLNFNNSTSAYLNQAPG